MAHVNGNAPKITLYTNHRCPWAHRAHIVLKELGLKYDEVIIDLDTPREPWYLEINPRGLVPSIDFNGEIITESGIVSTFLADAYPSHVFPAAGNPKDALTRARINFFVDTWFTKAGSFWFQILRAEEQSEKEKLSKDFVDIVRKEIEPLLHNAAPFFNGSSKVTLAEALTAPFILRIYALTKHGLLPQSVVDGFDQLPNFSKWAKEVVKQESVLYIWDEESTVQGTAKKIESLKAQSKSK
ncbi:thioredoxin-like protein [Paraphoma chrysanthemicola]|uniref:Thioredoxin-like protein n=1 Tax=Paraphoma chrysanthemicola TaxID=798071 RepID=A0A8K0W3T6_9PLEO|nr:thioredoxin-like protein [Paraphoma chrysanthemicola]